ncbi:DUF1294 domain-containing protein [Microbulbifer taiwanensis]|uniref:DUF1294 domain-containing protein n=1 Tax=Microbulbifer taiwanensis TaxID=986746 RepID=A0ABW1YPD4_9GAMM
MALVQLSLAALFVALVGAAVYLQAYSSAIFYLILAASLLALIVYAMDKVAALENRRRISENRLHLIALAGGWPGALIAQKLFNHKTTKRPFRIVFWITVLINGGVVGWTFTDGGSALLTRGMAEMERLVALLGG